MDSFVKLDYRIEANEHPLDVLINNKALQSYNMVFFALLKVKRVQWLLRGTWKLIQEKRGDMTRIWRLIAISRQRMAGFLQSFEEYLCIDVIESAFHWLNQQVKKTTTFEDLVKTHKEYVETRILDRVMMGRKDTKIAGFLQEILMNIQSFVGKVHEYGMVEDNSMLAKELLDEIKQRVESYEDNSRFFQKFVEQLSQKGYYRSLNVRLQ